MFLKAGRLLQATKSLCPRDAHLEDSLSSGPCRGLQGATAPAAARWNPPPSQAGVSSAPATFLANAHTFLPNKIEP